MLTKMRYMMKEPISYYNRFKKTMVPPSRSKSLLFFNYAINEVLPSCFPRLHDVQQPHTYSHVSINAVFRHDEHTSSRHTNILFNSSTSTVANRCKGRYFSSLPDLNEEDDITTSANTNHNLQPFLLTDIGEGITEVELIQWYVKPKDKINQFDKVCEVQSDKATVEITSRYDGIVHNLNGNNVGDMVQVGQPLLYISIEGDLNVDNRSVLEPLVHDHHKNGRKKEILPSPPDTNNSSKQQSSMMKNTNSTNTYDNKKVLATPAVRKMGMEHDLDLSIIQGTGPNGRILREDVLKFLAYHDNGSAIPDDNNKTSSLSSNDDSQTIVPIRGYHRLMVNSMTTTLQVPHMTYSDEVEMSSLIQCRNDLNKIILQNNKNLSKISYLPFFIKACSLALKEYPILNSSIDVNAMNVILHSRHDIGIAMDSERGLVVPVIRNCESSSIMEIAIELERLRNLAVKGALPEKDLVHPTFTLSNIGSIGGTIMSPVILPPQVAIGAMGKIQRLPRFKNGESLEVQECHIMNMSWAGDHRVIDGATLGRFSNLWKTFIESPMMMTFAMK